MNSKYLLLAPNDLNFLTPSPSDITMDSPSPLNCMYICNNNLFTRQGFDKQPQHPRLSIDSVDSFIKTTTKHPGQAVKIITESTGEHKIIRHNEDLGKEVRIGNDRSMLKISKSCTNFDKIAQEALLFQDKPKSNVLKECKSCDENLIKFIFTKHGIQVISDVETIV